MATIELTITLEPDTSDERARRIREDLIWQIERIMRINMQDKATIGSTLTIE